MSFDLAFDYQILDTETRIVIRQRLDEAKSLMRQGLWNMIKAGGKFAEIRERLRHNKSGGFDGWIEFENLGRSTIYQFINLYEAFGNCPNFGQLDIQKTAAYLLAAPSTPDEARQEAIERAQNGETITCATAREIRNNHKPPTNGFSRTSLFEDTRPLFIESSHDGDGPAESPGLSHSTGRMSQQFALLVSQESEEWYTPIELIELIRQVLGDIDLDPASCEEAQQVVRAAQFFTRADDGLSQPWHGRVFLNPPYTRPRGAQSNQDIWARHLLQEFEGGRVNEAILLTNAKPGYNWFENLWDILPTCFIRQRVSFTRGDGAKPGSTKPGDAAKVASVLFYLGGNLDRFIEVFREIGRIILPDGRVISQAIIHEENQMILEETNDQ